MAEKIYTIPINEAFERGTGCPLCHLTADLETSSLEYIMGAAMMEPDVRLETNRLGFCKNHYSKMLSMKNRLSLALMLESHLTNINSLLSKPANNRTLFSNLKKNDSDRTPLDLLDQAGSCFICNRVGEFEKKYISNIIYMWKKDETFRQQLSRQEYFCLYHHGRLLESGQRDLNESLYLTFSSVLLEIQSCYLETISQDVSDFCKSFDHSNARIPLTEAQKCAIQRAINFLAGEK